MLLRCAALLLAFSLLAIAPALAQESTLRGTWRLGLTVDDVRYKLPVVSYNISSAVIQGETVPMLNIWIATADAQEAGLPTGSTLKGKLATKPRFFQQAAGGRYHRITMTDILISSVVAGTDGVLLQLNLGGQELEFGGQELEIKSPRDPASGQSSGRTLRFSGKALDLGDNDWD